MASMPSAPTAMVEAVRSTNSRKPIPPRVDWALSTLSVIGGA